MNDSTLVSLKVLVERVVRPLRASLSCKRKMREELLAHVTGVFEDEEARLGEAEAALERTAQRFGDPLDVAAGCLYLASNEGGYITGQTLHINGGMAMV